MEGLDVVIVSSTTALFVSIVGTLVTSGLEGRRRIDDTIRDQRVAGYRELWQKTKILPRWPKAKATKRQISELAESFRDWYFEGHGMYLSAASRDVYGKVQQALVDASANTDDQLSQPEYDSLMEQISALRTALTNDLLSRTRAMAFRRNREA